MTAEHVRPSWTFLSNHGHVLLVIAADADVRMRDIAERVGITERAAQIIVSDLEEAGYLTRTRVGRRNTYHLARGRPFRHPAESNRLVDDLIDIFRDRDREKVSPAVSDGVR